jgi:hypothetical protein
MHYQYRAGSDLRHFLFVYLFFVYFGKLLLHLRYTDDTSYPYHTNWSESLLMSLFAFLLFLSIVTMEAQVGVGRRSVARHDCPQVFTQVQYSIAINTDCSCGF